MYTLAIKHKSETYHHGLFRSATEACRYGFQVLDQFGVEWDWEVIS